MATPDGKVAFEAGGRGYVLQFTTNRVCLLEDRLEKTTLDIATELQFNPQMKTVRAIMWAGLGDGDLTLAEVGDLMDLLGKAKAVKLAKEAFDAGFPEPETEKKAEGAANPPGAAAG